MITVQGVTLWTLEDVAKEIGVSESTVRIDIRVLGIKPEKLGGAPILDAEIVGRLKQYRSQREREIQARNAAAYKKTPKRKRALAKSA